MNNMDRTIWFSKNSHELKDKSKMSHNIPPKPKKDKEYIIRLNGRSISARFLVTKTFFDDKNPENDYMMGRRSSPCEEIEKIMLKDLFHIEEPVNNAELFIMWTNWNSMKRIDLERAERLRHEITNTLKARSYVQYGTGKLEAYDYEKMYELRTDINADNYKFKVGQEYELQNGEKVRILGRTDLKGYECLICSDGAYRYDRSTDSLDSSEKGRCTATSHELLDPRNILNEKFGNRYLLGKEFCEKENVDMKDLCKIEMDHSVDKIKNQFYAFLKSKNITSIWSTLA